MNTQQTLCKALFLLALAAGSAQAQQVYRIVGPDGKVTFSDRPPENATGKAAPVAGVSAQAGANAGDDLAQLPFDLRAVAQRFPVTLYTGPGCGPCDSARGMLRGRGVPFTEKTVQSNADVEALKRISGDNSLPFGTIGGQFLKGFADTEWSQYLDAAGYPRQSQLPSNYRAAQPSPLVAVQAPSAAAAPAPSTPRPAAAPSAPRPTNPAGIQF